MTLGAQAFNDQIYFFVEDDGPGIAEADITRLGRPFEQADTAMANGLPQVTPTPQPVPPPRQ